MNRFERTYRRNALRDKIASFLGVVIGTFLFWLVGFVLYKTIQGTVIYLCDVFEKLN